MDLVLCGRCQWSGVIVRSFDLADRVGKAPVSGIERHRVGWDFERNREIAQTIEAPGPSRLRKNSFAARILTSAAEAASENKAVIAALKSARENSSFAPPGLDRFPLPPTADAVGCILTPLRG
jgi:hypothetical protein